MNSEDKKTRIATSLKEALTILGVNFENKHFEETPNRIAKAWVDDIFKSLSEPVPEIDSFKVEYCDVVVEVGEISFSSTCAHHFMPFVGKVLIKYIPEKDMIGLSKFPRVVEYFSKFPTLQEVLTEDIFSYFQSRWGYRDFYVEVEASHSCVSCRGVKNVSAVTKTKKGCGIFLHSI